MTEVGWTEEEYAACPELASRLHVRILDLQDENEAMRELLLMIVKKLETPGNEEPLAVAKHVRGVLRRFARRQPRAAMES